MQRVLCQKLHTISQQKVCQNIVETLGKVFSVDVAILLIINTLNQDRGCFISYKFAEILSSTEQNFFQQNAFCVDSVLLINDVEREFRWQEKYQSQLIKYKGRVRSILAVPLVCQNGFQASINLYSCQKIRVWNPEEVGLAVMMAAQAGLAISQTYAYEDMKALAQREATINRVTAVIRSSLESQAIYNAIVTELGGTLGVSGCSLSLWTKEEQYMRCVALYNPSEKTILSHKTRNSSIVSSVPIANNPLLQKLIDFKEPVCLSDLEQKQNLARFELPWRSKSRALLIVPLMFDGEIMGSITLREEKKSRSWRSWEVELAKTVASQAAIAVTQAELYETTKKQAIQLQISENKVKQLNNYLTESILKRFLPEAIALQAATGELALDLTPEPLIVTVLFCDLVGFTRLSSQLEVDILSELLNDYLEAMTQAIFDNSGTIDKFVGDGVMALFGAPEELSVHQQAQKAIATAKRMYHYLKLLNQKWQAKQVWQTAAISNLQLRCGIHQGRAVVGMFGGKQRKDYTAIGKVVNIAARLQQVADSNSILISETVFNCLTETNQEKIEPKSVQLKGIESDFRSYSLSMNNY